MNRIVSPTNFPTMMQSDEMPTSERTSREKSGRFEALLQPKFKAGGIHRSINHWNTIHVSPFIQETLQCGYSLPFSPLFWSKLSLEQARELNFRERATVPWEETPVSKHLSSSSIKIPKFLREVEYLLNVDTQGVPGQQDWLYNKFNSKDREKFSFSHKLHYSGISEPDDFGYYENTVSRLNLAVNEEPRARVRSLFDSSGIFLPEAHLNCENSDPRRNCGLPVVQSPSQGLGRDSSKGQGPEECWRGRGPNQSGGGRGPNQSTESGIFLPEAHLNCENEGPHRNCGLPFVHTPSQGLSIYSFKGHGPNQNCEGQGPNHLSVSRTVLPDTHIECDNCYPSQNCANFGNWSSLPLPFVAETTQHPRHNGKFQFPSEPEKSADRVGLTRRENDNHPYNNGDTKPRIYREFSRKSGPEDSGSPTIVKRARTDFKEYPMDRGSNGSKASSTGNQNLDFNCQKDPNRQSARRHKEFVNEEIFKLLETGAVSRLPQEYKDTVLINPLSVAENGRKPRLILDLSYLNMFMDKVHFKLDDLQKISHCLPENGYMCTFDFRSGYHHVLIAHAHRRFLAFEWEGELFWFNALPFGLSSAPFLFTKLLRPWVKTWRERSLGFAIYLDDGLIWGRSRSECQHAAQSIRQGLTDAGFSFSEEKCEWTPAKKQIWLGFLIDLDKFEISLKQERWEKGMTALGNLSAAPKPSLRDRMVWAGTLASLHLLITPDLKRRLKATQIRIAEAQERHTALGKHFRASKDEVEEWELATDWLGTNPHRSLRPCLPSRHFNSILSVDASDTAAGAVFHRAKGQNIRASRELPQDLLGTSSTQRELFAIEFGLKTFSHRLVSPVLVRSDSQAAVAVFAKGSLRPHLQKAAEESWQVTRSENLQVTVMWVPREENVEADLASREFDDGDWRINPETSHMVQMEFQFVCSADLFANDRNCKTDWFTSKDPCPGSQGCDAFRCAEWWMDKPLWLVPPVHLVPQTIVWMRHLGAKGILGAPFWPSQPYYPMLRENEEWNEEVRGVIIRKPGQPIFDPKAPSRPFGDRFSRIFFAFFLLDFSEEKIARRRIIHLSPPAFVVSQSCVPMSESEMRFIP